VTDETKIYKEVHELYTPQISIYGNQHNKPVSHVRSSNR